MEGQKTTCKMLNSDLTSVMTLLHFSLLTKSALSF